jgi:hypothetical protein
MKKKVLEVMLAAAVLTAGCAKKEETFEMKMRAIDQYVTDKINVCACETKGGLTRWEKGHIITSSLTQWISAAGAIGTAAALWSIYKAQ